jgi:hypothetical protein
MLNEVACGNEVVNDGAAFTGTMATGVEYTACRTSKSDRMVRAVLSRGFTN